MNDRLQIGELVLRVPDLDAEQARRLVDEVLARIRSGLPADPKPATLRRIDLRLTLPRGKSLPQPWPCDCTPLPSSRRRKTKICGWQLMIGSYVRHS